MQFQIQNDMCALRMRNGCLTTKIATWNKYKFNKKSCIFLWVNESKWYSSIAWIENNLFRCWNLSWKVGDHAHLHTLFFVILLTLHKPLLNEQQQQQRQKCAACLLFLTCFILKINPLYGTYIFVRKMAREAKKKSMLFFSYTCDRARCLLSSFVWF